MPDEELRMNGAANRLGGSEPEMSVSPWRASVRARWAEIVFLSALSSYTVLAVLAHIYTHFVWDLELMRGIKSVGIPGFRPLMVWLSALGSGWVPTALVGSVGIGLALARFRLEGVVCIVGVTLGAALNSMLKVITGRPRPSPALVDVMKMYNHDSFPSGHVVFFVEYFGFLLFLSYVLLRRGRLRNSLFILFGALIALIGVSRVYMGAHWPSDVLGAYLAGGMWLMVMISIYRRLKARQAKLTS